MPLGSITVIRVDELSTDGIVRLMGDDDTFALITVEEYAAWKAVIAKVSGIPVAGVSLVGRTLGPM